MRPPRRRLVQVTWEDAFCAPTRHDEPFWQHSVGWVVKDNKRVLAVAQTWNENGPNEVLHVPRAYVRRVVRLKF